MIEQSLIRTPTSFAVFPALKTKTQMKTSTRVQDFVSRIVVWLARNSCRIVQSTHATSTGNRWWNKSWPLHSVSLPPRRMSPCSVIDMQSHHYVSMCSLCARKTLPFRLRERFVISILWFNHLTSVIRFAGTNANCSNQTCVTWNTRLPKHTHWLERQRFCPTAMNCRLLDPLRANDVCGLEFPTLCKCHKVCFALRSSNSY